jgi:hypothetical protein
MTKEAFTLKTFRPARSDIVAGVEGHFLERGAQAAVRGVKTKTKYTQSNRQDPAANKQAGKREGKQAVGEGGYKAR